LREGIVFLRFIVRVQTFLKMFNKVSDKGTVIGVEAFQVLDLGATRVYDRGEGLLVLLGDVVSKIVRMMHPETKWKLASVVGYLE
jgi:hypothetical protein